MSQQAHLLWVYYFDDLYKVSCYLYHDYMSWKQRDLIDKLHRITTECSGVPVYITPGVPIPDAECVTTTQPWTGTVTEAVTIHATGRVPGTKIVKIPGGSADCVTTTVGWSGTVTETVTIPPYGKGPSTHHNHPDSLGASRLQYKNDFLDRSTHYY